MPPALDLEQAIRQLGLPIEEYRSNPYRMLKRQKAGTWMVLSGTALLVGAFWLGRPLVLSEPLFAILFTAMVAGFVLLATGFWFVATAARSKSFKFVVFEQGFHCETLKRVEWGRWDTISTVRMKSWSSVGGRRFLCQLRLQNGSELKFVNNTIDFPGIAHLCDRIQLELTSRQLPQALETFEQGETLRFGLIKVDSAGITKGKRFLPWKLVRNMQLEKGAIVITSDNGPIHWPDATPYTVPNIFVLLSLVEQVVPRMYRVPLT